MLNYVYGHDKIIAHFVAQRIPSMGGRNFPPASRAIGVIDEEGHLIAGLVYHNYNPQAGVLEMSGAAIPGKQWLTRETLRRMYQYPFLQVGCQMLMQTSSANNEQLLRILKALNYNLIRVPRLLGRDEDAMVCLLTYEDWIANKMCRRFGHHLENINLEEAA